MPRSRERAGSAPAEAGRQVRDMEFSRPFEDFAGVFRKLGH
jgi:hypothetical protein